MARWRLMQPHYINIPGTEWEYKETDRNTGKQGRKLFEVPTYLNPDDPADHNYPGEIIVADRPGGRDHVFLGRPTPDMEPLDDEAKAISKKESVNWKHPIESLAGNYSQSLLEDLQRQVDNLSSGGPPVSGKGVSQDDFAKLQEQVLALMAKNTELETKLARRA